MATIRQIITDMKGEHVGVVSLGTLRELARKTTITKIYVDAGRFGHIPIERSRALEVIETPYVCSKARIELVPLDRENFYELYITKLI